MRTTPLQERVNLMTRRAVQAAMLADAAARRIELERFELRKMALAPKSYRRACFICSALSRCQHRESELLERWEGGKLA